MEAAAVLLEEPASVSYGRSEEKMGSSDKTGVPQHLEALARANSVRVARAALKRSINAGSKSAADVLEECPAEAASMTIAELLCSQRGWGNKRTSTLLRRLAVSETRELSRLSARQRRELALLLSAR